jgi:hypothetical protein
MTLRRRGLLVFTSLAVAGTALGVAYLACYEPAGAPLGASSGGESRVYLAGLTWGKAHRVTVGNGWQRALLTFWPDASGFGGQTAVTTTARDELAVWLRMRGSFPSPFHSPDESGPYLDVVDEHGCSFHNAAPDLLPDPPRIGTTPRQNLQRMGSGGGDGLLHASVPVYPRRAGSLECRVGRWASQLAGGLVEEAKLVVPVPITQSTSLGPAESLPIRRWLGDTELVVDQIGLADYDPLQWGDGRVPQIRYHTGSSAPQRPKWIPLRIAVSDATGNRRVTNVYEGSWSAKTLHFDGLCRYDPAWSYEFDLVRSDILTSPADRVWKFRLPVPRPDIMQLLHHQFEHQGATVQMTAVAGVGQVMWPEGDGGRLIQPSVRVSVPKGGSPCVIAMRLTGSSYGRLDDWAIPDVGSNSYYTAYYQPAEPWTGAKEETTTFDLPIARGTNWVDVELRMNVARRIAFVARPPAD